MIRRKIWATATCCLALTAAAQGQTGAKASLGKPQKSDYIARGAEPNPGYPVFVPRSPGFSAPATPHYSPAAASLAPRMPSQPAMVPQDLPPENNGLDQFATEVSNGVPQQMPSSPVMGQPMGQPMGMPMGMPVQGGMPMMQGDIVTNAPYLDGMGSYDDGTRPTCWGSVEFLNWRLKGVEAPPLVTAGGTGAIGDINARILYGNNELLDGWETGVRFRGGVWFQGGNTGIDVAFFSIGNAKEQARFGSDGSTGLFRPFFNTAIGLEDAQLVAFPGVVSGGVAVDSDVDLLGGELNLRQGWGMGLGGKIDVFAGYRYVRLRDTLEVRTDLTTLADIGNVDAGARVFTQDRFEALNQFHGGQVGIAGEWGIGAITLGARASVAAGITDQRVTISGASGSMAGGTDVVTPGGLLALQPNIGERSRTRFSVLPEAGFTVGCQVHNNIRLFGGYNVMLWTNVARAGEQVDRNVNSSFIADPLTGAVAPSGAPAPTFHHRDDHFFTHGWTAGLEFRW